MIMAEHLDTVRSEWTSHRTLSTLLQPVVYRYSFHYLSSYEIEEGSRYHNVCSRVLRTLWPHGRHFARGMVRGNRKSRRIVLRSLIIDFSIDH